MAMLLLEKRDFLFSFDLKSGYHHVDIAREHWKYLGSHGKTDFTYLQFFPLASPLHATYSLN